MCWSFSSTQALLLPRVALACLYSRPAQKPCVGSTYVSRYRRSRSWHPGQVQLASAVRPQFGQTWRTWPDLPHLKHSFSGHIVWRWLVEVEPARYTRPRGLGRCHPSGLRGRPAPRVPGGTTHSWGRSTPGRRWCTLPRHRKFLPCMRC